MRGTLEIIWVVEIASLGPFGPASLFCHVPGCVSNVLCG